MGKVRLCFENVRESVRVYVCIGKERVKYATAL